MEHRIAVACTLSRRPEKAAGRGNGCARQVGLPTSSFDFRSNDNLERNRQRRLDCGVHEILGAGWCIIFVLFGADGSTRRGATPRRIPCQPRSLVTRQRRAAMLVRAVQTHEHHRQTEANVSQVGCVPNKSLVYTRVGVGVRWAIAFANVASCLWKDLAFAAEEWRSAKKKHHHH